MMDTPTIDARGKLADAETVDLAEFCNTEREEVSEAIHVLFEKGQYGVALFRNIGEAGGSDWLRTDIDNARVKFSFNDREPSSLFLSAGEAETLLTLLDRMRVERSEAKLTLDWLEYNNSEVIEDSKLDNESLLAYYRTDSGRSNRVEIHNTFCHESNRMAKFS